MKQRSILMILFVLFAAVHQPIMAQEFFEPVQRDIEGWRVHIEPALIDGQHSEEGKQALAMLTNHLQRIKIVVPQPALSKLQTIEIWIEHEHPKSKTMCYHPSIGWLEDNDHDPRLAKKVHVVQAAQLYSREQMLKHPAMILHELAHGYHDQHLGFDNPKVVEAFEAAKERGDYEEVLDHRGVTVKHYGLNNAKEYFAEATEAFFYRNDFYPFVAGELKQHDPKMYSLLQELWEDETQR